MMSRLNTYDEAIEVLIALKNGKVVQMYDARNGGYGTPQLDESRLPNFLSFKYRVKPEPREFYISAGYRTNNSWQAIGQGLESGEKIRVREVLDNE